MRYGELSPYAAAAPATVSGHFRSTKPLSLLCKLGKADRETTASQETGR
jgi:hypothetical protein